MEVDLDEQLRLAIRTTRIAGVTGNITFGNHNRRSDRGKIFHVVKDVDGEYRIAVWRSES